MQNEADRIEATIIDLEACLDCKIAELDMLEQQREDLAMEIDAIKCDISYHQQKLDEL